MMVSCCAGMGHGDLTGKEETSHWDDAMNLEFMIELDKSVYRVGDVIELSCSLKNAGSTQITLGPIFYMNVKVFLGKKGQPLGLLDPHVLMREKTIGRKPIILSPGQTHEFKRSLGRDWYTLPDTVGGYSLHAVYESQSPEFQGAKVWTGQVKSNTVDFELIS